MDAFILKRYQRKVGRFLRRLEKRMDEEDELSYSTLETAERHIKEGRRLIRECAIYLMDCDDRASWGKPCFDPNEQDEDIEEQDLDEMDRGEAYKISELVREPAESAILLADILFELEKNRRYL
ncbi:MAG TPA: hypothetical protein VIR98_00075 [Candidatus Paceibacterota bacterium]|jgi:hypothetical protein